MKLPLYKFVFACLMGLALAPATTVLAEEAMEGSPVKRLVVLDPGHGGRSDSGLTLAGHMEKDVTLRLAELLRAELIRDPGLAVALTRSGDTGLTVLERSNAANRRSPALFVSLHLGSSKSKQLGLYVSRFVKDSRLSEAAGRSLLHDSPAVPWELAQNRFLPQSKRAASLILRAWREAYSGSGAAEPRGLPLAVLAGVYGPAVLVELPALPELWEKESEARHTVRTLASGILRCLAGE